MKWIKWLYKRKVIIGFLIELITMLDDHRIDQSEIDRLLEQGKKLLLEFKVVV